MEYDEHGQAVLAMPKGADPPSPQQAFRRQCYASGITDRATVDELWREEQAKHAPKEPDGRGRRRRRERYHHHD